MTAFESAFIFDRVTSVAAMQEQLRNSLANCRGPDGSLQLSAGKHEAGRSRLDEPGFRSPKCRWPGSIGLQDAI